MITNEELQAWGESRRAGAPSPAEAQELVGRVRRRRGWRWLGGLGLVGGAAVAVLLLATVPRLARWSNQETQVEEAPALADVPPPETPTILTEGSHQLGDDLVEVHGELAVFSDEGTTRLTLRRGRVTVEAAERTAGDELVVEAASYTVRVLGTVFTVVHEPFSVEVVEGVVAVVGDSEWTVRAGERFEHGALVAGPRAEPSRVHTIAQLRRLVLSGDEAGARAGIRKRLRMAGDEADAWVLLAQLETRSGHIDEAVSAWREVIALDGASAQQARYEAALLLLDQQPTQAIPLLRSFLEQADPLAAEARLRLGRALLAVGDQQEARVTLRAVVDGHPGTSAAVGAARLLRQIDGEP